METIFDFTPTAKELRYFDIRSKEDYMAELKKWEDLDRRAGVNGHYRDYQIALLFEYRGDSKNMEKYLSRFAPQNSVERADFFRHKVFTRKGDTIIG